MSVTNGNTSLYIATFSIEPEKGSTVREADAKFIEDIRPYLTPLIADGIGGYNIRVVSRNQNGTSVPDRYTILTRRSVRSILKRGYDQKRLALPTFSRKAYAWFDGYISNDRDLEKLRADIQAIPNAGPSFVSLSKKGDLQLNVRLVTEDPKELEELNQRLIGIQVSKPRVSCVVTSILETEIDVDKISKS